jgi:ACDE family multidrug resistance protein
MEHTAILLCVFLLTLAGISVNSVINPVMPLIREELHFTPLQTSFLISIVPFVGIFASPLAGYLADRYSLRRSIIVPHLVIGSVAGGIGYFTNGFVMLFLLRLAQGISSSLVGFAITLIADCFESPMERSKWISVNACVLTIGLAINPVIGGLLAQFFGWRSSFLVFWGGIAVAVVTLFAIPRNFAKSRKAVTTVTETDWKAMLLHPLGIVIYSSSLVIFLLIYMVPLFGLPFLLASRFHSSPATISIFLAIGAIATAIISLLYWKMKNFTPFAISLPSGLVLMASGAFTIAWATKSYYLVGFGVVFYGAGEGWAVTAIVDSIPQLPGFAQNKAVMMSLHVAATRVGQVLGPVIAASIQVRANDASVIWTAGIIACSWALLTGVILTTHHIKTKNNTIIEVTDGNSL